VMKDFQADLKEVEALKNALHKLDEATTRAEERANSAEEKLEDRYAELAYITKALLGAEAQVERSEERLSWLLEVVAVLISNDPWWWNFMPRNWQRTRKMRRLARRGLFDAQTYVTQYPDVAQAGLDPLHHYMFHGLREVIAGTR
jgi:chromosome condensin MukBEF ATPase and DNA-binding subunit MukB